MLEVAIMVVVKKIVVVYSFHMLFTDVVNDSVSFSSSPEPDHKKSSTWYFFLTSSIYPTINNIFCKFEYM